MKNKLLRATALKLWVDNKFILKQYDTGNIFVDDEINENVSDENINYFLHEIIYKTIPNTPKQKFNIGDFDSPYVLKKVNVDIDGFIKEKYIVEKNNILGNVTNDPMNFLKKSTSPLEEAYNKINSPSSYLKLFTDGVTGELTANLLTATHSSSIRGGYELENIIYEQYIGIKSDNIRFEDVIDYINKNIDKTILFKKVIISEKDRLKYNSKIRKDEDIHVDFIFYSNKKLYIRELKETGNLDTQKESTIVYELDMLNLIFTNALGIECHSGLALWACKDAKKAKLKKKENIKYIITGLDLANLFNVNYDFIVEKRKIMNEGNQCFVLNKMAEILQSANLI